MMLATAHRRTLAIDNCNCQLVEHSTLTNQYLSTMVELMGVWSNESQLRKSLLFWAVLSCQLSGLVPRVQVTVEKLICEEVANKSSMPSLVDDYRLLASPTSSRGMLINA